MLRNLKKTTAQAVMGEYVLLIVLVMAVLMAMGVYFRRAMQARIHDARDYMINGVRNQTAGYFDGTLYKEYEPYYGNTSAIVSRDIDDETRVMPGGTTGIFRKIFDEEMGVVVNSDTASPLWAR
jgi:hypothetical protein